MFRKKLARLFSFSYSSCLILLAADRTGWNIEPKDVVAPDFGQTGLTSPLYSRQPSVAVLFLFSPLFLVGGPQVDLATLLTVETVLFFIAKLTFHL